jgi:hypothetical protein
LYLKITNHWSSSALAVFLLVALRVMPSHAQSSSITYNGPLVITKGGTYSGNWQSLDSSKPAISIQTSEPVVIENSNIRSAGILIWAHYQGNDVTVRNTRGYGLTPTADNVRQGRFFDANNFKNARIEHNYMEQTSGIYLASYTGDRSVNQTVKVLYNQAREIDGRYRNGGKEFVQFVQFNALQGLRGIEIAWNEVINTPNKSAVEDNINLFHSNGTADSPILIHDNFIKGGYPTPATAEGYSGGGILLGDGYPTSLANSPGFAKCYNNQVVNMMNYGIALANGHDIEIYNNRVVSSGHVDGQYFVSANVGMYTWNSSKVTPTDASDDVFFNISVHDNQIGYVKKGNWQDRNDMWFRNIHFNNNNVSLPNPITVQTEEAEWTYWLEKTKKNNIKPGLIEIAAPAPAPNLPPSIVLSTPGAPQTLTVGQSQVLSATASDADGSVKLVEFFQGSTKVGETATAPYQFTWTAASPGSVDFTARATDNAGLSATSSVVSLQVLAAPAPAPTPAPAPAPAPPANALFYRAININGSAVRLDGNQWEAGNSAPNVTITGNLFSNQNVKLRSTTDDARAQMIRSSVSGRNVKVQFTNLPNGAYNVYVYVWEDNKSERFSLSLNNKTVLNNYTSGSAGNWDKVGPLTATVTDGTIRLASTGGEANISGIEIWNAPANAPSTVNAPSQPIATNTVSAQTFPNPFEDVVTITTQLKAAETMNVALFNQVGRLIQRRNIHFNAGIAQSSIDMSSLNLPSGRYYLMFLSGSLTGKMLKLNK